MRQSNKSLETFLKSITNFLPANSLWERRLPCRISSCHFTIGATEVAKPQMMTDKSGVLLIILHRESKSCQTPLRLLSKRKNLGPALSGSVHDHLPEPYFPLSSLLAETLTIP